MSEKKVVSRNIAITLGIICIIFLVGLVGAVVNYTAMINSRDNTISTKDSQIQTLTNQKNQLQTCLDGNMTLLNTIIAERDHLQVWLDGNITYYNSLIGSLNSQITSLQNQISSLNSQVSSLNAQIEDLQDRIASLQSEINTLEAPKLIKVNLRANDSRPWIGTPYLHVYGEICNVGTNTAYNCKLHVVAYQSGGVVALNTYINLGTIYGESWKSVDSNIYYNGDALTSWTITPEWTS